MTEICGRRAFSTAWTAKHFRKFVRIVTKAKKKYDSFPLKNIKILIPTPPSFSAREYFWGFNLQQHSFNSQQLVLKICNNYFKFAANLFNLQQLYFICSNFLISACPSWATAPSNTKLESKFFHVNKREKITHVWLRRNVFRHKSA